MRTAALVYARGGSRRLPRKNVRPFCGVPLLAWTVVQAKCSQYIDEVYLTTDDDEMADVGEEYGAVIIRRPDWPNPDELSASVPCHHALRTIREWHPEFEFVSAILPTQPVRRPFDIDGVIRLWREFGDPTRGVTGAAKNRETVLYEASDTPGCVKSILFDKSYRYLTPGANLGHTLVDKMLKDTAESAYSEKSTDDYQAIEFKRALDAGEVTDAGAPIHYEIESWQVHDTDTLAEFELAELAMEHFILKGRGLDVYYDYAETWRTA